jgi:hypothetical protein
MPCFILTRMKSRHCRVQLLLHGTLWRRSTPLRPTAVLLVLGCVWLYAVTRLNLPVLLWMDIHDDGRSLRCTYCRCEHPSSSFGYRCLCLPLGAILRSRIAGPEGYTQVAFVDLSVSQVGTHMVMSSSLFFVVLGLELSAS